MKSLSKSFAHEVRVDRILKCDEDVAVALFMLVIFCLPMCAVAGELHAHSAHSQGGNIQNGNALPF